MKATRLTSRREVFFDISGGPIEKLRYGKTEFQVDRVRLVFERKPGETWRPAAADVSGLRALKNGGRGNATHGNSYWSDLRDWPGWLLAFAADHEAEVTS